MSLFSPVFGSGNPRSYWGQKVMHVPIPFSLPPRERERDGKQGVGRGRDEVPF